MLIDSSIRSQIDYDGLYGFTGQSQTPEEPSDPVDIMVKKCGAHVHVYVLKIWPETTWETAWFVNPPVWYLYFSACRVTYWGSETSKRQEFGTCPRLCSTKSI